MYQLKGGRFAYFRKLGVLINLGVVLASGFPLHMGSVPDSDKSSILWPRFLVLCIFFLSNVYIST